MAPTTAQTHAVTDQTSVKEPTKLDSTTAASSRMQNETIENSNQALWRNNNGQQTAEQHLPTVTLENPEAATNPNQPKPAEAPKLNEQTVKQTTHELYEAINGDKPDNDKIHRLLDSLNAADRKAIEDAYRNTNGNTDHRDIRTELKDNLGDEDYRKVESSLNKRDGRTNDAGNLMVSLSAMGGDRGDAERRVIETFATLNAEQQQQLKADFQQDYGKSVEDALKDAGLSDDAKKAVEFARKPVEQRTAQDIEAFAKFAIEKGNLDYFSVALRGDSPAAVEARKNLSNNEEFKKQIVEAFKVHQDGGNSGIIKNIASLIPGGEVAVVGFNFVEGLVKGDLDFDRLTEGTGFDKLRKAVESKEVDSKLLQAMDILKNGQVSLATIAADNTGTIFGWFDNKDAISNAAEHATESERKLFAQGQQLAQSGGEAKTDEEKNALSFYNKVHEAFEKAGNDNEPKKWEDRLVHGKDGSVVSQILDSKDKEGRYVAIESLSQKDWQTLKDPAAGAAFRKQIEDELKSRGNAEEAATLLKLLDKKLAAGSYEDSQKVIRSLSDLVTTSPHSKTAVATIAGMTPEEATRYKTDAAFRAQVDTFLHDKMDELGQVASSRLLAQVAETGQAPKQDAIDKLFSAKLNGVEGKDAIADIEAVLQDSALRQKLSGNAEGLSDVERQIKTAIDEYITAATPGSQTAAYGGRGAVPAQPKENEYLQAIYQSGRLTVDQKAKLNLRGDSFFSEAATVSPEERQKLYDSGLISKEDKQLIDTLTQQGGKMSLVDELRASVIKDGTEAEAFASQLKGLSAEDKQKLKDEYARKYGSSLDEDVLAHVSDQEKNNFRTYLTAGEVDGRQDFYDNLERALHSESGYSPDGSQEVLERALNNQAAMLSDFQARYEKLPPEKQEEANQLFTAALKDYQESKEKFAEKMFQAAVIVGGVAVGVATGGVGLVALASVVAIGAAGRIALKKAIQGNDYDLTLSNALKDAAIGGATAGLSVLGPETVAAFAGVGKAAAGSFLTSAGEQVAANVIKKDASTILQRELNNVISSSVVRGEPISKEVIDGIVAKVASSTATADERAALSSVLTSTLETSGRQVTDDIMRASFAGMGRQAAAFGTVGGTANVAIEGTVGLANGHFDPSHLPQSFLVGFGLGSGMSAGLETAVRGAGKYASRDSVNAESTPAANGEAAPEANIATPEAIEATRARIAESHRAKMSADEALENAIPAKIEAFAAGTEVPAYGRLFNSPGEVHARNFERNAEVGNHYVQLGDVKLSPRAGNKIYLGRNANSDYQLATRKAGDVQSEIELTQFGPVIRNLNSKRPTLLNGQAIPPEGFLLHPGSEIKIGNESIIFGGAFARKTPMEYVVRPGSIDNAARPEALRQSERLMNGLEISERLEDGFQLVSHDVPAKFNQNWRSPEGAPVVFDVVDRTQDSVLRQTIQEAHARFDSLKHNPEALATELVKFSKSKMMPQGWTEQMLDTFNGRYLMANQGRRMLLGNYIQMAQLGEGGGVCLQQAALFKTLADEFGLDVRLVLGHYGGIGPQNLANIRGNHAWDQVNLDGHEMLFDPRHERAAVELQDSPQHLAGRNFERPMNTGLVKLNELKLYAGDRITYQGSPMWKVSNETSKQPGHVVLTQDGLKTLSIAEFMQANPGRRLVVGDKYEVKRSNGNNELGWIFDGRNADGSARFRKADAVKIEVPLAALKAELAPKYVPFNFQTEK